MKRWGIVGAIGCLFVVPSLAHAQRIHPENLRVLQLELSPDPVQEGQRVGFRATIANSARESARVALTIKDRDEIIGEALNFPLRPGENQVVFPERAYRFSRAEHCFTVEVEIERTRSPIALAQQFCAKRMNVGWTLRERGMMGERGMGPLFVEELEIYPDPALPGQEIQFRIRLRNDGRPIRGTVRIQDRDQVVAQADEFPLPRGSTELQLGRSRYAFQRSDTCFTVLVDVERTPFPVDAARKFCARPAGWTLRAGPQEQRQVQQPAPPPPQERAGEADGR